MSAQSLRDYLRAQREERIRRSQQRMVIPIPGYEDMLAGRYRVLSFDDKAEIASRHGGVDLDAADTNMAADYILNACEDLLEITAPGDPKADPPVKPTYQSLGKRWMAPDVADLFGVDVTPETTAIQAVRLALDSDQIVDHLAAISTQSRSIMLQVDKDSEGEPEPAAAGLPNSEPQPPSSDSA